VCVAVRVGWIIVCDRASPRVLQCVAVCCSLLQFVADGELFVTGHVSASPRVCYTVLHCVALCYNVLHCVCGSV